MDDGQDAMVSESANYVAAKTIAVNLCDCGCGNIKVFVLDHAGKVHATFLVPPGRLAALEARAMASPPAERVGRMN